MTQGNFGMELPGHFEQLLRRRCRFMAADANLDPQAPLAMLGIDSLAVVELIVDIEDQYSIEIPQELLTPEVFACAASIWLALRDLVNLDTTAATS